jgi:diguanylate cyclase (GGDEF)-like protein
VGVIAGPGPNPVARQRATAGLIAAGSVILALLTVFAIELSNTQARSRSDVRARVHERSVLAAALIDSLFQTVGQQLPQDEQRFGGRVVTEATMDAYRQQNAYLALLDRSGRVLASSRGFTRQAQSDLARSAALALLRSGHPWGLGNVLPYGRTGVINLAVAFPTAYGPRFLLTGFPPSALGPFLNGELRKIPGVRGAHNYVIDGNDFVLASTDPARPVGYRFTAPAQVAALNRPSGERHGYYYDLAPLANATWRVVLAAPAGPLFSSVSGFSRWLSWLIFVAFALVAAAALLLGGRVVRSAESRLRDTNARLEAVNQELEQTNARLAHDALHDPLTGLANRELFMDRLEQILKRSVRDSTIGCAVVFVDLDGFKLVNDSLGHVVGDQLLVAVAGRLNEVLRPGDTVARLGGDEFALLLDGVQSERDATIVAERVRTCLARPVDIGAHSLFVRASIGISLRSPAVSAEELLRNADIAMYAAKRRGRDSYALFDQTMHRRVVDRLARENELRQAIEQSLVEVHYQPIVDLVSGEICQLEALARWPRGWRRVPSSEFIPIAEDTGLIRLLGAQVMRTALYTLADWRQAGLVSDEVGMSVNLSRRELDDPTLPEDILGAIAEAGLPASALSLEITESMLMQEPERMQRIVTEVCARGVRLHLDDFGTEYSSLASLLQFPVVALKIDRSFITASLGHHTGNDAIVRGTIALAHGLGLRTIAEGIEQPTELDRLRMLGCDSGQGFLFSAPLDRQQTEHLLEAWTPSAAAVPADAPVSSGGIPPDRRHEQPIPTR